MADDNKVRITFDIASDLNQVLEEASKELCSTKSDFLRRAIALGIAAHNARKEDKIIGVFGKDNRLEKEFIGI